MKELKMVKKLIIIMLSVVLIIALSNFVYAADEDPFLELTATNTNSDTNTTNTDTSNSLFTNTQNANTSNSGSLTTNTNTNTSLVTNTDNSVNRNVTNTDTLAKTGLSDSNGIVALIVILCAVSAIYSYKKVNDYKKL